MSGASSPALSARDELPRGSRYELLARIASGGMATVYVGRLRGAEGFWRLVAIKRAHPHLLEDPEFRRVLVREARLASRIHHPNVVSVQDVEERDGELLLVMDFIEGAALSTLLAAAAVARQPIPPRIAVRVVLDAAHGLHAAHELADDDGKLIGLVHRDVSPQNILVGQDGAARIADFGIAKGSVENLTSAATSTGVLKGKLAYMAPEYIERGHIDPRGDVFALGVVLWEALANQRLFRAPNEIEMLRRVAAMPAPRVSEVAPSIGDALDAVVARVLEKSPEARYPTARDFAEELEAAAGRAGLIGPAREVGEHVRAVAGEEMTKRRALLKDQTGRTSSRPDGAREISAPVASGRITMPSASATALAPMETQRHSAVDPEATSRDPRELVSPFATTELVVAPADGPLDLGPQVAEDESNTAITMALVPPRDPEPEREPDRASETAQTTVTVDARVPLSTFTTGEIAPLVEGSEDHDLLGDDALRTRRRARIAATFLVGALAVTTAAVAASRLVAPSALGARPALVESASTASPPAASAGDAPRVLPAASDRPSAAPAAASASASPPLPSKHVDNRAKEPVVGAASHPTTRASAAPVARPAGPTPDRAPPNPYAAP